MGNEPMGLGWRVHSWWAVVVAVRGPAESPEIVHREKVMLLEDETLQEPYHAACSIPIADAPALIESVHQAAAEGAAAAISGFVKSLGPVAAVGVVGGDRQRPELAKILTSHARLHAAERDLYERAVIQGANAAGVPVTTIPATGQLFDEASEVLGVPVEPALAALAPSIGKPWQKDHKEAAAAALVALQALTPAGGAPSGGRGSARR